MARKQRGGRQASGRGSGVGLLRLLLHPLTWIVLVLAAVAVLAVLYGEVAWAALGWGLAPAGIYAAALLGVLFLRPVLLLRWARWWLAAAVVVPLVVISLALVPWTVPLAGTWGASAAGPTPVWGAGKLLLLLTLIGLVVAPVHTLRFYRVLGKGSWKVARKTLRGAWRALLLLARAPRFIFRRRAVPRWVRRLAVLGIRTSRTVVGVPPRARASHTGREREALPPRSKPPQALPAGRVRAAMAPRGGGWQLPTVELLGKPPVFVPATTSLQGMARRIEQTMAEHGVEVTVEHINPGPRVIQFGLTPGWARRGRTGTPARPQSSFDFSRVKVDSILAREKDLALALKASSIRMEAPVPGEAMVGVEVPNPNPHLVALRSVVEHEQFRHIAGEGGLPVALGVNTSGEPVALDLREMPHLLIAGATGSGKSVCINAVIASMLLTRMPDDMRLLLVDPKRVELTPFNGIPHLLCPVMVEVEHVVNALHLLVKEMTRRYKVLEKAGARNILAYHQQRKPDQEPMPYLVVVIDELADLMMMAAGEVESALVRLAQLGRASGIHLIVATQRPSVNVVTGLLKANIPARVAFAVSSQVDSRVILDGAGAEKLLGKGDMLLLTKESPRPRRLQGCYVSDGEIERIVDAWKGQQGATPPLELAVQLAQVLAEPSERSASEDGEERSLLDQARQVALRHRTISTSVLQRRLRIGYAEADRLLDMLEEEGVVAPGEPGKARQVLATAEDVLDPS